MKKAIIFDLDGTLWDSTGCAAKVWNSLSARHDDICLSMTEERAGSLMGKIMEEICEILFPDLPETRRREIFEDFSIHEQMYLREHGAVLYDGVQETLKKLRETFDLYIVSNSQDGYVQSFLYAHDLGVVFKDFEMSGRTGLSKGENIRLIMDRNDVKTAVYVGDTESDEKAARFAGIPFIYASYGFGQAVSPDGTIDGFSEIEDTIKAVLT
ncbi:MAG: HAD family hydrolase [Firmicutes bacterium]|nr:HAD family hydrolase [Bacillota bacterium]